MICGCESMFCADQGSGGLMAPPTPLKGYEVPKSLEPPPLKKVEVPKNASSEMASWTQTVEKLSKPLPRQENYIHKHVCPYCGRCPHCGRGGWGYPVGPYWGIDSPTTVPSPYFTGPIC